MFGGIAQGAEECDVALRGDIVEQAGRQSLLWVNMAGTMGEGGGEAAVRGVAEGGFGVVASVGGGHEG